MKINIRRNAFETNSSSMHSIAIVDNADVPVLYTKEEALADLNKKAPNAIKDNVFYFNQIPRCDRIFDWGVDIFNDFYHKMIYSFIDLYSKEMYEDDLSEFWEFASFIKDFLGVDEIKFDTECRNHYNPLGEIDHQSWGLIKDVFSNNPKILLTDFVLNKNYILIIDNDNH